MQIGPSFANIAARKAIQIATYGNTVLWNTTAGEFTGSAIVHVSENPTSIRHLVGDQTFDEAMITGGRIVIFVFAPADYANLILPGSNGSLLYYDSQWFTCKPANGEIAGNIEQFYVILGVGGGNQ